MKLKYSLITILLLTIFVLSGCNIRPTEHENMNNSETITQNDTLSSSSETISESETLTEEIETSTTTIDSETTTEAPTTEKQESETENRDTQSDTNDKDDSDKLTSTEPATPTYTFTDLDKTMYVKSSVTVRDLPEKTGTKLGSLSKAKKVKVTGQCNETKWYRITYKNKVAYVSNKYLSVDKPSDDKESSSDKEQSSNKKPSSNKNEIKYDPADINKDGMVTEEEAMSYVTPNKQKCIDAGYGVVVEMDGGEWYGCLMKSDDHTIEGKDGLEILWDYLAERDLEGQIYGSYISIENEWYFYTATDIRERFDENDAEFWD